MQGLSQTGDGKSSTHVIYREENYPVLECTKGAQRSGINLHYEIDLAMISSKGLSPMGRMLSMYTRNY